MEIRIQDVERFIVPVCVRLTIVFGFGTLFSDAESASGERSGCVIDIHREVDGGELPQFRKFCGSDRTVVSEIAVFQFCRSDSAVIISVADEIGGKLCGGVYLFVVIGFILGSLVSIFVNSQMFAYFKDGFWLLDYILGPILLIVGLTLSFLFVLYTRKHKGAENATN